MDNMNDMLSSVLGDPESLRQIQELADMLKDETGDSSQDKNTDAGSESGSSDFLLFF